MAVVQTIPLAMLNGRGVSSASAKSINNLLSLFPDSLTDTTAFGYYSDLVNIEYNRTDAILYLYYANGSIVDVSMTPLSAFGVGPRGIRGRKGTDMKAGFDGRPGANGDRGCPGPPGVTGKPGLVGDRGPTGQTGEKGLVGDTGPIGMIGLTGYKGIPNRDIDDPCANCVDEASIGDKGPAGKNGIGAKHYSFVRRSEPPLLGINPVWGQIVEDVEFTCTTVKPSVLCTQRATVSRTPAPLTNCPSCPATTEAPPTRPLTTARPTTTCLITGTPTGSPTSAPTTPSGTTSAPTTSAPTVPATTTPACVDRKILGLGKRVDSETWTPPNLTATDAGSYWSLSLRDADVIVRPCAGGGILADIQDDNSPSAVWTAVGGTVTWNDGKGSARVTKTGASCTVTCVFTIVNHSNPADVFVGTYTVTF
jgi:hypothetical protein